MEIYITKVVICLFVCSIRTQEPLDRFASNYYGELGEPQGPLLYGKIEKIVIYHNAHVNCDSNCEYPGQHLVLKLVYDEVVELVTTVSTASFQV